LHFKSIRPFSQQLKQALPVASSAPHSGSGAPMTADAYLASVRAEAASFPATLVARSLLLQPQSATWPAYATQTILQPPPHATPPAQWARALLAAFDRLQNRLSQVDPACIPGASELPVPRAKDADAWRALCWVADAVLPRAAVVSRLDYTRVMSGLRHFDGWLRLAAEDEEGEAACCVVDALLVGSRAHWLFALLASLFMCVFFELLVVQGSSKSVSNASDSVVSRVFVLYV
jgi:Survival motor neuron (SMN) interacting protein 1 (SIP1)